MAQDRGRGPDPRGEAKLAENFEILVKDDIVLAQGLGKRTRPTW
jgi:hypothetical protein